MGDYYYNDDSVVVATTGGRSSSIDYIAIMGNLLLFCLVFGMSATVDIKCLQTQLRNKKAIATGIVCQFILLPFLGFCVVKFFTYTNSRALTSSMGITLLVVTSSPGGSYSNWWCSLFNADLALSVTMTAISTILSIFVLPLNLLLYTKFSYDNDVLSNIDWKNLFIALSVVIAAIAIGLYCSYCVQSYSFNRLANNIGNISGLLLILFSGTIANVNVTGSSTTATTSAEDANGDYYYDDTADTSSTSSRIWSRPIGFYIAVALPCILGLIISNCIGIFIADLKKPEVISTAIECCYQNVGIATSLALTMFDGKELNNAISVPFFYGLVEAWMIGIYCIVAWKMGYTKAPCDENFWKVLTTSYEILKAEEDFLLETIEVSMAKSAETPDKLFDFKNNQELITTYYNYSSSSSSSSSNSDSSRNERYNKRKEKKKRKKIKKLLEAYTSSNMTNDNNPIVVVTAAATVPSSSPPITDIEIQHKERKETSEPNNNAAATVTSNNNNNNASIGGGLSQPKLSENPFSSRFSFFALD